MAKNSKTAHYRIHQLTVEQFEANFPNEDACRSYLVKHRWPSGVVRCPRCGFEAHAHGTKPYHWQCYNCGPQASYRFSVLVNTVFENTNKPLRDWFRVIHMMTTSKKGVSALQVFRTLGFGSYKTAWYMCHRIRVAMQDRDFLQLLGIVEVDETFIGGDFKNKHKDKRGGGKGGGGGMGSGKTPVVGAIQRKGNVVARVVENIDGVTLLNFVREAVSRRVSLICTDNYSGYSLIGRGYPRSNFPHRSVNHARGEYVAGVVHTNTIEGFWSILKRGVMGTYHKISAKYLPLYVAEFSFRYNNRENEDIFGATIKAC